MDQVLLILRALALCASFGGLCCLYQRAGINRYIAPAAAASSVIVVLMLCGMGGFLTIGWNVLYVLGFAGLIDAHFVRRQRFDWQMLALLAVFAAWLVWRFYGCYLWHNDDVSHWGLVARYLLETNHFPGMEAEIVKYQSYPLGAASFIYYVAHSIENSEGMYMIAQNFLMGLYLLPMLSNIKANRRYLYPLLLPVYLFMFTRSHVIAGLQVDWLLAYAGFSLICSLMYYRKNVRLAMLVAVPQMMALVYMKSSGIFFAMLGVVTLFIVLRACGWRWRKCVLAVLGGTALVIGTYMLWSLHVKTAYVAGFESKHAVSLTAYAAEFGSKGSDVIGTIAKKMLTFLIKPKVHQMIFGAAYGMITGLLAIGCWLIPGERSNFRKIMLVLIACASVHFIWYAMLYFMYLFSMPVAEAIRLASIQRYTSTSLSCVTLLGVGLLFAFYGRKEVKFARGLKVVWTCGIALAAMMAVLLLRADAYSQLLPNEREVVAVRKDLQTARETLELEDGSKLLVFCTKKPKGEGRSVNDTMNFVRYELVTNDMMLLSIDVQDEKSEYVVVTPAAEISVLDDPIDYVKENIDSFDAFILLDCEEQFDAGVQRFMEEYDGKVPIYRAY